MERTAFAQPSATRTLRLGDSLLQRLQAWSQAEQPHEACGLMIGMRTPTGYEVEYVTLAENVLPLTERMSAFVMDPKHLMTEQLNADRAGLAIVGIWHSHPSGDSRPSSQDLQASWPGYAGLIVATPSEDTPLPCAWELHAGQVQTLTLNP
ncbi:MAG: proteasome lid subunit RPN8/RPN11 [Planctomycetota bacterium]|jgi:proteasome lid subunit RPN8/RPN11